MRPGYDRPGYDARRRNRNIGTENSGFGQDNRLTVPQRWIERRSFYEILNDPRVVKREVHNRPVTFFVEPTRDDCCHACTVDDVVTVLRYIPRSAQEDIDILILRQPTRKQQVLRPAWGRFSYWTNLGRFEGSAIVIEAQVLGSTLCWSRSLDPAGQEELSRLREDGHVIEETKREYRFTSTLDSIRATQLYRTLPHEVGHNAHYLEEMERGSAAGLSDDDVYDRYFAKPSAERESYAHRFADTLRGELQKKSIIPFDRIGDGKALRRDGLDPGWFGL